MTGIDPIFLLMALVLAALTISAVVAPLLRKEKARLREGRDIDIYKDQLAEVDRDLARGVLTEEEAERTRTEISRRILAADAAEQAERGESARGGRIAIAALAALLVGGGATALYVQIGAPGKEDQPRAARIAAGNEARANRIGQLEAEAQQEIRIAAPITVTAEEVAAIEQAREILQDRPDDLRGWSVLGPAEARLHNYAAAAEAQARVLNLKGEEATDQDRYLHIHYLFMDANGEISPDLQALILGIAADDTERLRVFEALKIDARVVGHFSAAARAQEQILSIRGGEATPEEYAELLDYMVAAANGFVSPEAETIAVRLLQGDQDFVPALYYAGRLYAQTDRPDRAFGFYRRVIELGDPDSLHVLQARREIEDVAWLAGVEFSLPEEGPTRGPTAEDIAAAEDMDEEARAAMIGSMVDSLSERLATEGGTVQDWAQLIRALSVLGQTDRAAAILEEGRTVFASDPASVQLLDDTAREVGLGQ